MAGKLRLYIGGTEYRTTDRYNIREQVGQTATAQVFALLGENDLPVTQQRLQIREKDGVTVVYTGIIQSIDPPQWSTGFETYLLTLNVKSLDIIFDNRIVNEAFENMTTTDIVDQLFDTYLLEENLTKGTIGTFGRSYEKYIASGLTLRKVLNELGDSVSAAARIDENGEFTFTASDEFQEVTPPTHLSKLRKAEDGSGLVTVQRLTGASEETSLLTESTTWAANQSQFTLGYQVSSVSGVTINGSPAGVGLRGVDESDPAITFLWRYGENNITVNPDATTKPATSDIVAVVYYGFFGIEIISENEVLKTEIAELAGTSGKIESMVIDSSITTFDDGQDRADDLLAQKGTREETISGFYVSDTFSLSSLLNLWELSYPDIDIEGRYVIVERKIIDFGPDQYKITIKAKNKNFYSRYGTVLEKNDTQVNNLSIRTDDLVFKNNVLAEIFPAVEAYLLESFGVICFPAETDGSQWGPANVPGSGEINEFFPV